MQVQQIDTNNRHQVHAFLNLPFQIYQGIPQWVPPLRIEAKRMLDCRRHPYYRHSEATFFLAYNSNDHPIGRLAVLNNQRYNEFNQTRTAFFYLFECIDSHQAAQALFTAAAAWAKERGLNEMLGPKGFTALDGMGLLVKGFEHRPAFGIPYNLNYYQGLLEGCGFEPETDIVSGYLGADLEFPDRIHQLAQRVRERRGLHIARYRSRRDLLRLTPRLQALYNAALGGTSGNVPLTDEEARTMADQLLWFADPRLVKVVMKEEQPVGFLFAYPDVSAAPQRSGGRLFPWGWLRLLLELRRTRWVNVNGMGMAEGYRGLGGTALLFSEMYKSVREGGFEHGDLVQVSVENSNMQRELRGLGIEFYKTHRIYRRSL